MNNNDTIIAVTLVIVLVVVSLQSWMKHRRRIESGPSNKQTEPVRLASGIAISCISAIGTFCFLLGEMAPAITCGLMVVVIYVVRRRAFDIR